MSTNSSPSTSPPSDFRSLIFRSLDMLRREHPDAYQTMGQHLQGMSLTIQMESEPLSLGFSRGRVQELPISEAPSVHLRSTVRALLDVLEGRASLLEAVSQERLLLRGEVRALARFHEGLVAYLHGAVRCPSFPALLDVFRAQAGHSSGEVS